MPPPTILVAEDDPAMQGWLVLVLTRLGCRTHVVSDGWQVWPTLMEEDVDLVVSDFRMPMQSGLEALTVLRLSGLNVPFLLITAYGSDDVLAAAAELGAEVLHKPFGVGDLVVRVRRMCGLPE